MIVVVEGPSAAGKTTWIRRHCVPDTVVAEPGLEDIAAAPDRDRSPEAAAEYWVQRHAARWARARRVEQMSGIAVCDGDPVRLHYVWSLWRTGHAGTVQWTADVDAHRTAFADGRLGIADLILVTIPDAVTLERRRRHDHTRRRRHFDVHRQLGAPLTAWYRAVEALDPARVIWRLPATGLEKTVGRRTPNSGTAILQDLLDGLPGL